MTKDKILKQLDAESYFYQTNWRGYKVYGLDFGKDATVGLPMFILENEKETRLTTIEEAFAIIETFSEENDD